MNISRRRVRVRSKPKNIVSEAIQIKRLQATVYRRNKKIKELQQHILDIGNSSVCRYIRTTSGHSTGSISITDGKNTWSVYEEY